MSHTHDENCHCRPTAAVQSLDELEFDRGIWSAGNNFSFAIFHDIVSFDNLRLFATLYNSSL